MNLVTEIKKAKYFSVSAEEVNDCSNVEQLAIALRFVDSTLKLREKIYVKVNNCFYFMQRWTVGERTG